MLSTMNAVQLINALGRGSESNRVQQSGELKMAITRFVFKPVPRDPNQPPTLCMECEKPATRWVLSTQARFSAPRCYLHAIRVQQILMANGATDVKLETIGQPVGPNASVIGGHVSASNGAAS